MRRIESNRNGIQKAAAAKDEKKINQLRQELQISWEMKSKK